MKQCLHVYGINFYIVQIQMKIQEKNLKIIEKILSININLFFLKIILYLKINKVESI